MSRRRASREGGLVPLSGGAAGRPTPTQGKVWLVGAGPGDPDLLTLRAARVLASADVVVHDRLVGPGVVDLVPAAARRLYVGKRKSHHSLPQEDVNDLLVALAREGLSVVRLKGGDPFLFGRGGEELLACRAAGVPCEVVPGVSAALAAAASVGAPLTHRALAQSVTFVTGHAAAAPDGTWAEPDLDWGSLARANHTVAVYMGVSTAAGIAARLIAAGRSPATPVVIVEAASLPEERRVKAALGELARAAEGMRGPAVMLIGEAAGLAEGADAGAAGAAEALPAASSTRRRP